MRRKWTVVIVALAVVGAIGGAAWLVVRTDPQLGQRVLGEIGVGETEPEGLSGSGFIEAGEVDLASELGGRIVALSVAEGDVVEAGETVVQLDTTLIEAQIAMARARLATAEAALAQARAPARPEQVRQAEAGVRMARRLRDGAQQAREDLLALRDRPQELEAEIARARAEVEAARAAVAGAEAVKDAAEIGHEAFHDARDQIEEARDRWKEIPAPLRPPKPELEVQPSFHLLPNEYWKAWVALNAAKVRLEAARTALNDLLLMRDNPQELEAEVDAAETRHAVALTRVEQARARLDALKAGATTEQVALLKARVEEAEAGLATLLSERDKLTIAAPVRGVVLGQTLREGELAAPGATILTLGEVDEVTLTVFVPVPRLGEVEIDQDVAVQVDGYGERTFAGEVVAIAEQAEFAPREIEIREERMNLVFGVEIRIPNPDHAVKPGAYAEAYFDAVPSAPAVGAAGGEGERDRFTASGFIEGEAVTVATEVGGRVAEMAVERGDAVRAGEVVVRLDDAALKNQRREAQAGLSTAEANLAIVRAGARPEEIRGAEGELAEAEVIHAGAVEAVVHAREAITNPQGLDARVHEVRSQVALAEQGVEEARAELAAVELQHNIYAERGGDIERTWDLQVAAARAAVEEAEAQLGGARAELSAWLGTRANPLDLRAELHGAETEADAAEIEVAMLRARLEELQAGPTEEELNVAEGRVAEARAAIGLHDARIAQLTLEAPVRGVVSQRLAQVGEAAVAGRPLLTIVNLDEVTLTVYVPQRHMAWVEIGQPVSVAVKAYPERTFSGHVSRIAGEAEFTPSDILTEEERVNLVFAVEVTIPNLGHALRPGMPADATLELQQP